MTDSAQGATTEAQRDDAPSTPPNPYRPIDVEQGSWDAVVIGTGMGGATAGYALARRGWRVLFIEKGHFLHGPESNKGDFSLPSDDRPHIRLTRGWWPYPVVGVTSFGNHRFFAPLGCGSGGTSTLYAAQLERFRPEDFRPRAHHPQATDSTLPESWPIGYDELVPYYEEAEKLYRVSGTPDPLDGSSAGGASLREPPPLSERDHTLFESFRGCGLHPYRAHVACEFVEGCLGCGGTLCPRNCKTDSARACLLPALRDFGAKLLDNCEVVELEADAHAVRGVRCRLGGREISIRGRIVVLAAGAFVSPALLLKSRSQQWPNGLANSSDQVGRNLMLHAHAWVAVSAGSKRSTHGPLKSISLNDFYVDDQAKLGTFQSLGMTADHGSIAYYLRSRIGSLPRLMHTLLEPCLRLLAHALSIPFRNAAIFAGIIEDLPYAENRVLVDSAAENGLRFEYRYPDELRRRSQLFVDRLRSVLKGHHRVMPISGRDNLDYGHVCGTVRFGDDPKTSVLDRDNRAHDVANLYVVDASFLPSSGGTNLSLTIAANALRVGTAMDKQLAAP